MFINISIRKILPVLFLICALAVIPFHGVIQRKNVVKSDSKYIKWVEFNIPASVMRAAMERDIQSQKTEEKVDFLEILAYLGAKNGGNFRNFKNSQINEAINIIKEGRICWRIYCDS